MVFHDRSIGQAKFFYARAWAHARSISLTICLVFSSFQAFAAADPSFIRGNDGLVHGITINQNLESSTQQKMKILHDCQWAKKKPVAMALMGSVAAHLSVHIQSLHGVMMLESLRARSEPKILETQLGGPYKNFPTSMFLEKGTPSSARSPLAIILTASLPDQGDLVLHQGDTLMISADGQLDRYSLPDLTIPAGGVLTVYPGTDDTLYYDIGLTHPLHEGKCKKRTK